MPDISELGIENVEFADLFRVPYSGTTGPMGGGSDATPHTPLPTAVLAWKMNWRIANNNEIVFYYDKVAVHTLPSNTVQDLKNYVGMIISGQDPGWQDPASGSLDTGASHMSIHHTNHSIMVFYLDPTKNWQFSRGAFPFQVVPNRDDYYTFARAAISMAGGVDFRVKPTDDGCKCALFVANAKADQTNHGLGPQKYFNTAFNIYVDLLLSRQGQPPRRLPIAIDPDVGHPGGAEP